MTIDIKKRKHADEMRVVYRTESGQEYELKKRKTPQSRYARAKYSAAKRGKVFTLELEEYAGLVTRSCEYCNRSLYNETGSGLDRIDNDRGYEPGNVNPCCKDCNRRRHKSMTAEEFKEQNKINGRWFE